MVKKCNLWKLQIVNTTKGRTVVKKGKRSTQTTQVKKNNCQELAVSPSLARRRRFEQLLNYIKKASSSSKEKNT